MTLTLRALIVLSIVAQLLPCYAITREQIIARLKESKLVAADMQVNADVDDERKTAVVTTFAKPEAQEKDFKIDAVLIAKEVMALDKDAFAKVRVLFYNKNDLKRYSQVTVRAGDIAAFASGSLKNEMLLDSLDVEKSDTVSAQSQQASVIDQTRLDKAQQAMAELSRQNVGVAAYKKLYDEIVALSGDSTKTPQAMEKLSQLEAALQEQRERMRTKTGVGDRNQAASLLAGPKVQAALEGMRESHNKTMAALPELMANPESARQTISGLQEQMMQQFQQFHAMSQSYFGHWKPAGEVAKHERMYLYYHYVEMEKRHTKMDSYWYQYKQIESMVAQFEQVERLYHDAVNKRDSKESGLRAAQLRLMNAQLLAKIDQAARQAGIQPQSEEHGWGEHGWGEHGQAEHDWGH